MQITDVLIHVNNEIDENEKENLVEQLRDLDGVIAPRFNEDKQHLLLVLYNSDAIISSSLLSEVKGKGYKAQLVGL